MSLPYGRCGRRKSSLIKLTVTSTTVPKFIIPIRRWSQQSETGSLQSTDSQQDTELRDVRTGRRVSLQRPSMTPTGRRLSNCNSSLSKSSLGFSPASILPNHPRRRCGDEGAYGRSSTNFPVELEPWSISNSRTVSNWSQAAEGSKLKVQTEATSEKTKLENSIKISLSYKPYDKTLTVQVLDLTCVDSNGGSSRVMMVELSLNSGEQRRVLSLPKKASTCEALFKTVVFDKMKSVSLSSRSLTVSVYITGLIPKRGPLLYQASTPLLELPLTGYATWIPLKTPKTKAAGFLTICMSYLVHKSKLIVTVASAKALKKSTVRKASYVEVNLLRGSGEQSKMKAVRTKAHHGGSNPVFKEAFAFEFPSKGLTSVYTELSFTVRRRNLLRDDEVLGRVTLSSEMLLRWKKSQCLANTLDEVFRYPGKVITQTHTLCDET